MAKKKFNPELLKEELKRFRMISEYSFYQEDTSTEKDNNLILGTDLEEVDENPDPADDSKTAANATGAPDAAANPAQPAPQGPAQPQAQPAATPTPEAPADDENLFGADSEEPADMGAEEMPMDDMGAEAPAEDEVEVDVTQLVQSGEEAKAAADEAGQKTDELLAKFNELEQRLSAMAQISDKIQSLEKEIIKRNPTPVEKLEMRAMDSFPYNIKLSDYFKDINGNEEELKQKEYVLTKDDIDSYTDASIKDTFNIPDYEEEDI